MPPKYLAIAVLALIGGYHAWSALVGDELAELHLGISGLALILAVVLARSRFPSPMRSAPPRARTPAQRRTAMLVAGAGTAGCLLWIGFGPWTPAAEFDVTGFLFVIQNVWQLGVLAVLIVVATTGVIMAWPR